MEFQYLQGASKPPFCPFRAPEPGNSSCRTAGKETPSRPPSFLPQYPADNESARPVAVVNQAMAAQYWRVRPAGQPGTGEGAVADCSGGREDVAVPEPDGDAEAILLYGWQSDMLSRI